MAGNRRPAIDFSGLLLSQGAHAQPGPALQGDPRGRNPNTGAAGTARRTEAGARALDPSQTRPLQGQQPQTQARQMPEYQTQARPMPDYQAQARPIPEYSTIECQPGGYSDDMFIDLSEEERHKVECNICYLVLKDCRQCPNKHLFCATCIITWSLSSNFESRDKCPVCRAPGRYRPDFKTEAKLNRKRVTCPEGDCDWRGSLSTYRKHRLDHVQGESIIPDPDLPPIIVPSALYGVSHLRNPPNTAQAPSSPRLTHARTTVEAQRLQIMFEAFGRQLEQRRDNIDRAYSQREQRRRENMAEVHSLGQRLDSVASDLNSLVGNMNRDRDRYRGYIRASQDAGDSLLHLSLTTPLPRTPSSLPRNLHLDNISYMADYVDTSEGRLLTPPDTPRTQLVSSRSYRLSAIPRSSNQRLDIRPSPRRAPSGTGNPINTLPPKTAERSPFQTSRYKSSSRARSQSLDRSVGQKPKTGEESSVSFRAALSNAISTSRRSAQLHPAQKLG